MGTLWLPHPAVAYTLREFMWMLPFAHSWSWELRLHFRVLLAFIRREFTGAFGSGTGGPFLALRWPGFCRSIDRSRDAPGFESLRYWYRHWCMTPASQKRSGSVIAC